MDVERLISEIFVRPSLWDKKDKNHHNRFVLDKYWNEVGVELNTTQIAVRTKWKNLRDKFRTTLASISEQKLDEAQITDYRYEWKYFKNLLFLKDQFTPRNTAGNFPKNENETTIDESSNNDDYNEIKQSTPVQDEYDIESPQYLPSDSTPFSSRPSSSSGRHFKARYSRKECVCDALLQVEKEKLQYLKDKRNKKDEDDEDLYFFKSLLPHIRTFSAYDKLEYRMKVMKLTQEFLKQQYWK